MPFGYEMLQDPDVVESFIGDVGKLMKRNCELYALLVRAEGLAEDMYSMIVRGHAEGAAYLYEAHTADDQDEE